MANPLDDQTPSDVSALLGNVPVTVVTASAGEIAAAIARGFVNAAPKIVVPAAERAAARERSRRPLLLVAAVLAALLLFLTGTAVILGPAASAVQARANLTIFQGNVDVRTGTGAYAPAGTGTVLRQGDTIRTRALANAALTFFDESIAVLEPGTEIEIVELRSLSNGSIAATLRQISGSTWHVVSHQSSTRYAVTTPTSTASVTGTAFTVRVDPSGASTISTTEGSVEVRGVDAGAKLDRVRHRRVHDAGPVEGQRTVNSRRVRAEHRDVRPRRLARCGHRRSRRPRRWDQRWRSRSLHPGRDGESRRRERRRHDPEHRRRSLRIGRVAARSHRSDRSVLSPRRAARTARSSVRSKTRARSWTVSRWAAFASARPRSLR